MNKNSPQKNQKKQKGQKIEITFYVKAEGGGKRSQEANSQEANSQRS
jgi:hypothetical protein